MPSLVFHFALRTAKKTVKESITGFSKLSATALQRYSAGMHKSLHDSQTQRAAAVPWQQLLYSSDPWCSDVSNALYRENKRHRNIISYREVCLYINTTNIFVEKNTARYALRVKLASHCRGGVWQINTCSWNNSQHLQKKLRRGRLKRYEPSTWKAGRLYGAEKASSTVQHTSCSAEAQDCCECKLKVKRNLVESKCLDSSHVTDVIISVVCVSERKNRRKSS